VAAAVGVSERTVRKWLARYRTGAERGLVDRSCRPRRSPTATPPLLVSWVETLRRQRWTGAQIAAALQLSASTVARLARRHGLARLRQLEPRSRFAVTSGRGRAICCTSISRNSVASAASAIG
jgi:transposase-like protein